MRKLLLASAVAAAVLATSSVAMARPHYGGPQGFQQGPTTVAGVLQSAYDDQFVTLQGRLIAYLGHDRYSFQDQTGVIDVELDDDRDWSYISKNELIQITAKVDRDFWSTELDVKQAISLERGLQGGPHGVPVPPPAPRPAPAPVAPAPAPAPAAPASGY